MDRFDQELSSLFTEYRAAVPDPDASVNFMPRLWGKIEAKRSFVYRLRKMSQVAVAAALVASLIGGVLFVPLTRHEPQLAGSYVDVIAEAHADDALTAPGIRLDLLDADQH